MVANIQYHLRVLNTRMFRAELIVLLCKNNKCYSEKNHIKNKIKYSYFYYCMIASPSLRVIALWAFMSLSICITFSYATRGNEFRVDSVYIRIKILSVFLLFVLSSLFVTNQADVYPNWIDEDAEDNADYSVVYGWQKHPLGQCYNEGVRVRGRK